MKSFGFAALTAVCAFTAACGFDYTEVQDIEISHSADDERNALLAEQLIYYDPRFLAHKIPAFNEEAASGIQIGYFVSSHDSTPSYRITYNLSIDAVSDNLDDLKSQFEAYIPMLASMHVSKEPLFVELQPIGLAWAQDFFSESADTVLQQSSHVLRDYVTVAQLEQIQNDFSAHGSPTEIGFVRAQFYEESPAIQESVSLFYEVQTNDESAFNFRVSLHEVESDWRAFGFGYQRIR